MGGLKVLYVNYKKLTATAKKPTKGSSGAAGFDLYADTNQDIEIQPGETIPFYTGIAFEIPTGYAGFVYSRSGIATNRRLRLPHCVGVIDADFRGNVGVPLCNDSDTPQIVKAHERIAQIIFQQVEDAILYEKESLTDTERGSGGFGSTGR
jgi:dUTP pyrophosphatase